MNIDDIKKAIAIAMVKDRPGVINLLQSNGVIVNSSYSDYEIIVAVLKATQQNARFKTALADFLAKTAASTASFTGEGMFHFTGENMFRLDGVHPPNGWHGADGQKTGWGQKNQKWAHYDGLDSLNTSYGTTYFNNLYNQPTQPIGTTANPVTPSPSPTPTTPASSSGGGSLLSGVFSAATLSNLFNKGVDVLSTTLTNNSNKQLASIADDIEHQKTAQAALLAGGAGTTKKGLSTGAKIGIGIGVFLLVGTIVYFIVRKKK